MPDVRRRAVEEPRFTLRVGGRTVLDTTRLTQFGTWEGTITLGGERITIDPAEVLGVRDRSWGIRPVGEPEHPGIRGEEGQLGDYLLGTLQPGDSLAVAVSLFYGGTNLVLLLLQATAVPRLLVTRSLPTTAAIHPVLVIAGYVVFAAVPGFGVFAGTRTADQVMRLATARTAQEVSLSAFPPGPRARWKVLLRGAVGPRRR